MTEIKIDTDILGLFNKYYTFLKRDNPNNQQDALQAAVTLTQIQILKESFSHIIPQPQFIPPSYTYEFQTLNDNFKDLNNKFEDAKMDVVRSCEEITKAINLLNLG